jgi:carbon-monoxide dehydrogenase medium subunit
MASLSTLEHSTVLARHVPVVVRTMRRLSNVRVRNVATVGGALAHADPHMDLPPVLMALGASIAVAGPKGERIIRLDDLFTGYYETALAKNELITQLRIPPQGAARSAYFKVTSGSADDWPALGLAVAIHAEDDTIKSARIVVSAATAKATRLKAAEAALIGTTVDDKTLKRMADAAADEADIIADLRGSASYKRELLRVYAARAVRSAIQTSGAPR